MTLLPLAAQAAGLGNLTVKSLLGQPFLAEIELVNIEKSELGNLVARIAPDAAFRDAGIERAGALSRFSFSVEKHGNGQPYLKVISSGPVGDPFVELLVELTWPTGRLVREYVVLLDLPDYVMPQAATPPVTVSTLPATPVEAEPAAPAPEQTQAQELPLEPKPEEAAQPQEQPTPEKKEPANYGPVKKGDTLSKIARQMRPESISLEQMLVGLYRANKEAFIKDNMNRLKTGKILRMPEESELAALTQGEAVKEVRVQAKDFNAYRMSLAAAAVSTPVKPEQTQQEATGKITAPVEDKAATAKAPSTDVLKLSKGEAPGDKAATKALQDKVRAMEEDATAHEQSLKEANQRVAELEKNIKDMQKLLELKNRTLAEMGKKPQESAAKPAPPAEAKPAQPPTSATVELPKTETPAEAATQPAGMEQVQPAPPPAKPKSVAKKPKKVAPPPEPPLVDTLLGNPLYLGAGAGIILLGIAAGYMAVSSRRKKKLVSFENSIMDGTGALDISSALIQAAVAAAPSTTGDTSFLANFSQAGMDTIDTHDVGPIAEAEVYVAYGRDAQAEEILKEAMNKDPGRHEIRLKLLEIYARQRNMAAFETVAGELYAITNGQTPVWEKVAQMGHALDPENPLYGGATRATEKTQVLEQGPDTGMDLDLGAGAPAQAGSEGHVIEFDLDKELAGTASAPEPSASPDNTIVPDLPSEPAPAEAKPAGNGDLGLNFDFSLDLPEEKPATAQASDGLDVQDLGLDLGGGAALDTHLQEGATKLDLAKAYLEMGDKDGAREILQEVLKEGNEQQKADAEKLLAQA